MQLNLRSFELEVKCSGRYYNLYPIFQSIANGRIVHTDNIPKESIGFGGWKPYKGLQHPYSSDKQKFKKMVSEVNLFTPRSQSIDEIAPNFNYLAKGITGSFGEEIRGPYKANTSMSPEGKEWAEKNDNIFFEEFISGKPIKVWYWGAVPFFALIHDFPFITGNGVSSAYQLLADRAAKIERAFSQEERQFIRECLAFQGEISDSIIPTGEKIWIDFRYSRTYEPFTGASAISNNALDEIQKATGDQLRLMGEALASLMTQSIDVPLLLTADGVLDDGGKIWWLEMNTNSIAPPEIYEIMLDNLFPG